MAIGKSDAPAFRTLLPMGIGLFTYGAALARGSALLADPDVYLHVAVGRWIIAHGFVPHADVFSFSVPGAPWVPHEWLSEVIFATLYDQVGWVGLVALTGLTFALAMALLARALLIFLAPTYALIGTLTAWGLCAPLVLARPHVLAFPLVVAWTTSLVLARSKDRAPAPFAALLMVLWANLHGGFMIGLVLAALIGGEALFEAKDFHAARRVARNWGAFGLLSIAAAFVTPNGIAGVLLPLDMVRMNFALSFITEWMSPNFQHPQPLEIWLMLFLMGVLFIGIRLPVTRIVMLMVLLHMALTHRRHDTLLGMVTPLLLAPSLAWQLPRRPEDGRPLRPSVRLAASAVAIVFAVALTAWRRDVTHEPDRFTPAAALRAVKQGQIGGPVFNDFNFGGYLIWSGVPTFIDGRADMYGDQFVRRYASRAELPQLLSEYHITWTLLAVGNPDVVVLDRLPGWRRFYADAVAVVHVPEAVKP
jgi:hypothetical protein